LILPVVVPSLLYNGLVSWANGWFFLIASEIIAVGPARYTLPGLGSYLAQAVTAGRNDLTMLALAVLLATTVGMHFAGLGPSRSGPNASISRRAAIVRGGRGSLGCWAQPHRPRGHGGRRDSCRAASAARRRPRSRLPRRHAAWSAAVLFGLVVPSPPWLWGAAPLPCSSARAPLAPELKGIRWTSFSAS